MTRILISVEELHTENELNQFLLANHEVHRQLLRQLVDAGAGGSLDTRRSPFKS
jgi:hypothetical protein